MRPVTRRICRAARDNYAALERECEEARREGFNVFAASTTARRAALTASELPKCAKSLGSTKAIAKERRARAAYLPRGKRFIFEKSTSGIAFSEAGDGSLLLFIGSPFALARAARADDSKNTTVDSFGEYDEQDASD